MNYLEKGSFISKSEAVMLQAVAAMLMVWHHLFGFPERITAPYVLILNRFFPIETYLAYFGRICIAIFAFSSGYGLRKRYLNAGKKIGIIPNYKSCLMQLLKFFSRYWVVFFVFIPLGLALRVYSFDPGRFLKGVIGIDSAYNGEWWYVVYYIRFLLLFPVLTLVLDGLGKLSPAANHVFVVLCLVALPLVPDTLTIRGFLLTLMCFVEGMYFVDSNVFEGISKLLPKNNWLRSILGLMLFGAVFVLRFIGIQDCWLVALMVFGVMLMVKSVSVLHPALKLVGKYSTYIWLTHTFFGYYIFQKLTFFPRYSWLIFLWCMALSIVTGMVLEALLGLIMKLKPSRQRSAL